jgi:Lon protease-like protein
VTATGAAGASDRLAGVPLFPLGVVLFPGGPLPLRIFEPRYLSMVSRCLRDDCEFGVLLIVAGREAGDVARTTGVGTLARIVDWSQGADGLLNITARGTRKFRLLAESRQPDGLHVGDVALLPPEPAVATAARWPNSSPA